MEGRAERTTPEYARIGNPTVLCVEKRLAALEGAEKAQLFSTGMAAVTTSMLAFVKSGDHIVVTSDCFKRTRDFAAEFLKKFGVEASIVFPSLEAIRKAVKPSTRLIFTETPTNPHLYVVDVKGLAKLARKRGILTVVDSTFATPLYLRPLEFGIDLVVHSATKYLGGHNDLLAGLVAGRQELMTPLCDLHRTLGAVCDPETAYLLERGLKTLALRLEKHSANGQAVAGFLEAHPKIKKVLYPGLPSHPHHKIAARLMTGFGGVVSFLLEADFDGTARFVDSLRVFKLAPSLGGVESLVEQVFIMGYWSLPREEREKFGMYDNLVRLSLGIEDAGDLIADIEQALKKV
jgi:cystathionine gamma-synthase